MCAICLAQGLGLQLFQEVCQFQVHAMLTARLFFALQRGRDPRFFDPVSWRFEFVVFCCVFERFIPSVELRETLDLFAVPHPVHLLMADEGVGGV